MSEIKQDLSLGISAGKSGILSLLQIEAGGRSPARVGHWRVSSEKLNPIM